MTTPVVDIIDFFRACEVISESLGGGSEVCQPRVQYPIELQASISVRFRSFVCSRSRIVFLFPRDVRQFTYLYPKRPSIPLRMAVSTSAHLRVTSSHLETLQTAST